MEVVGGRCWECGPHELGVVQQKGLAELTSGVRRKEDEKEIGRIRERED